jgi:Asp-tRNA(Asn)/Glu-tRNA(Gln) amidotransferase A subunit family amidase
MHYSSVLALGNAIRDRRVSPSEVVEACLSRIDAIGSKLNG